jgi:hypothetical protein
VLNGTLILEEGRIVRAGTRAVELPGHTADDLWNLPSIFGIGRPGSRIRGTEPSRSPLEPRAGMNPRAERVIEVLHIAEDTCRALFENAGITSRGTAKKLGGNLSARDGQESRAIFEDAMACGKNSMPS